MINQTRIAFTLPIKRKQFRAPTIVKETALPRLTCSFLRASEPDEQKDFGAHQLDVYVNAS